MESQDFEAERAKIDHLNNVWCEAKAAEPLLTAADFKCRLIIRDVEINPYETKKRGDRIADLKIGRSTIITLSSGIGLHTDFVAQNDLAFEAWVNDPANPTL
jgi:hypothetical protein